MKKKELDYYQNLMKQKFDWEDKIVTVGNEIYRKRNERLQAAQQLRLVEDQVRAFFKRERVAIEEKECQTKHQ